MDFGVPATLAVLSVERNRNCPPDGSAKELKQGLNKVEESGIRSE